MEGKRPEGHTSIVEDLFGRKDNDSDILGSVLSPHSRGSGRAPAQTERYAPSKKQETEDRNYQGSRTKQPNTNERDRNPDYQTGTTTPCHLSSSLYYGGPDICDSSSEKSGSTYADYQYKKEGEDDPNNSNMASRGNWWQGSLYY